MLSSRLPPRYRRSAGVLNTFLQGSLGIGAHLLAKECLILVPEADAASQIVREDRKSMGTFRFPSAGSLFRHRGLW